MILAWSAPGIFGGDCLTQHVHVERGARVRLTSQSALQVHPAAANLSARLTSTYTVDDEAELQCEWDPMIPFAGARFEQRIDIGLAPRACLYWSDAFMNGRTARGERWGFVELAHELKISREQALEYVERYHLTPGDGRTERAWVAGTSSYFGTIVATGRLVEPAMAAELHAGLKRLDRVRAVADRLEARLLLVRLIGESGPPFHEARALVARHLIPEAT